MEDFIYKNSHNKINFNSYKNHKKYIYIERLFKIALFKRNVIFKILSIIFKKLHNTYL